jgi:hypothetical protein
LTCKTGKGKAPTPKTLDADEVDEARAFIRAVAESKDPCALIEARIRTQSGKLISSGVLRELTRSEADEYSSEEST